MKPARLASVLSLLACVLAPPAWADEVRLEDGRTLVGETRTSGEVMIVRTLDGEVRVPLAHVVRVRTTEELRQKLEGLAARAGDSAFGRLQLARTARDWGLYEEMWQHLDACLPACERSDSLRPRLRALLAELEPVVLPRKWRGEPTDIRVRELLHRLRMDDSPALRAAVTELLVGEPEADRFLRRRARGAAATRQRLAAVEALARRGREGNDRFVYRTAVLDGHRQVRRNAARIVGAELDTTAAVRYLAPGFMHESPKVRIRTAAAYANLADAAAIPILVSAGPLAAALPGGSTRAHVAIMQQQSYIRDFDVEVAQASFIADPKVDVLQSGVVLDVTVHAVITHRTEIVAAYRDALGRLVGEEPPRDPERWAAWWSEIRRQRASAGSRAR